MNKNKKGFTLIEIIFSVAFLSVVSIVMLRLLFASYEIEKTTDTLDVASIQVINEIEILKSKDAVVEGRYETWFDDEWQVSSKADTYRMLTHVTKDPEQFGEFYQIQIEIYALEEAPLVTVLTHHYYGKEKGDESNK